MTDAAGADPAGEDLGLTDVASLERAARVVAAPAGDQDPDWAAIAVRCESLFARTRDLRVALLWTRARLSVQGLPGLAEGLVLVAQWLASMWSGLHPRIELQDDPRADERRSLLSALSPDPHRSHPTAEAESFLRALRGAPLGRRPGGGVVTVRELEGAAGDDTGAQSWGGAVSWPEGALAAAAAQRALEALALVDDVFRRETGEGCRLPGLQRTLERVRRAGEARVAGDPAQPGDAGDAGDAAEFGGNREEGAFSPARGPGAPTSRTDAVHRLARIAAWVRAAEPSSPAPLFIDRAAALLQMDFADIVRTLMPSARAHVELLGGVALDADPR